MTDSRLIRSLQINNLLSYGPDSQAIELEPLNVLIGPNGSGKSNLIEGIALLRAAADDLNEPVARGGGASGWAWGGWAGGGAAAIQAVVSYGEGELFYRLAVVMSPRPGELVEESIETRRERGRKEPERWFHYRNRGGQITTSMSADADETGKLSQRGGRLSRTIPSGDMDLYQSVLSQRRDPEAYPEISYLAKQFEQIRLYREWNLGPYAPARLPQSTALPRTFLREDGANLALVLQELEKEPEVMSRILGALRRFYGKMVFVETREFGDTVQVYWGEEGVAHQLPATRISDGTLRYLCLLTILCHHRPPALICIEEPEIGMHPDIIRSIGELLIEASGRTQLIVTTHSDLLVSALGSVPEAVIVCEHDGNGSTLTRLDPKAMEVWLERYSLGDLWLKGEIGGTRW